MLVDPSPRGCDGPGGAGWSEVRRPSPPGYLVMTGYTTCVVGPERRSAAAAPGPGQHPESAQRHSAEGLAGHRWVLVAESPFVPSHGGGEQEHLGFVRAAIRAGVLAAAVVPVGAGFQDEPLRRELGGVPLVTTPRRTSALRLIHPAAPYVVASRPAPAWLPDRVAAAAPDATGVVAFSYKAYRIGHQLASRLGLPVVLRQHNREAEYHRSLSQGARGPRCLVLRWEAWRIDRDDRRLARAPWLAGTADISAADASWRRALGGRPVVHVPPFAAALRADAVEDTEDVEDTGTADGAQRPAETGPVPGTEGSVVFVGALDVVTNTAALDWFLSTVWEPLRAERPNLWLDVVGRSPAPALVRRLSGTPGVRLHADVPNLNPYLRSASVAVNPAVSGSGVNIKLVDYLAAGLPVVSTSLATAGLDLRPGVDLEVCDLPDTFRAALERLLDDPRIASAMGSTGRARVHRLLDVRAGLEQIAALLGPARPIAAQPASV